MILLATWSDETTYFIVTMTQIRQECDQQDPDCSADTMSAKLSWSRWWLTAWWWYAQIQTRLALKVLRLVRWKENDVQAELSEERFSHLFARERMVGNWDHSKQVEERRGRTTFLAPIVHRAALLLCLPPPQFLRQCPNRNRVDEPDAGTAIWENDEHKQKAETARRKSYICHFLIFRFLFLQSSSFQRITSA